MQLQAINVHSQGISIDTIRPLTYPGRRLRHSASAGLENRIRARHPELQVASAFSRS
jgi:hypothetical protein